MTSLTLATPETGVTGQDLPDETLIARVVGGELPLFELLMRRHNQRIYRTVRAILGRDEDCEDVILSSLVDLRDLRWRDEQPRDSLRNAAC